MTPARMHQVVTCMLVMDCGDIERCRFAERFLLERGYERRASNAEGGSCVRKFVREHDSGLASELLDEVCQELGDAISADMRAWKAFVHVGGRETAWATLEGGKPTLRGTLDLPRRPS